METSTGITFMHMKCCFHIFLEGKRHDAAMLVDSGLLGYLEQYAFVNGQPVCLYGDPAYPLHVHLQASYRNHQFWLLGGPL